MLEWCATSASRAIPFGGGTSVVGGVEAAVGDAYRGVVSLDLGALDRVLEVDAVSRAARIQAGALGPALEEQLAPHGLTLRHFPQSFEFSTLGGWIATRAGGHFATLYTHIDDLVESVRMVTPRRPVRDAAAARRRAPGPSPDRLVLGSEGILGVITEAWMRVQPRPRWRASASVRFARFAAGASRPRARSRSRGSTRPTAACSTRARRCSTASACDGARVLAARLRVGRSPARRRGSSARSRSRATPAARAREGPCDRDEGDDGGARRRGGERGAQAFLDAPYLQSALVSLGVVVDTFETACTWDRFDALHAAVTRGGRARDARARAAAGR